MKHMVPIAATILHSAGGGVQPPLLLNEELVLVLPLRQVHGVHPAARRVPLHRRRLPVVEGAADFYILAGLVGPGEGDSPSIAEVVLGWRQVAVLHETCDSKNMMALNMKLKKSILKKV